MGDLHRRISERARALGFDAVGFARADEPLERDFDRWQAFVAAEWHGDMGYLAEHPEARRRLDGPEILPGARTVVCLGRRYDRGAAEEANDPPLARRIARYARGRDYHVHLKKRLVRLAAFVRTLGEGVAARALCDTAPVLERAWAARSGLGFVAKNGLLIVPGQGSYLLLGEVVTTLALDEYGAPMTERCGSCTRCLDACPTEAFAAPFVLDPRRCVAYATIEARSPPPPSVWNAMGERLFGCDDCQSVCPYNRLAPPPPERTEPYRPLARWAELGLADLVALDEPGWQRATSGSPVRRATRVTMARNALLVASAHQDSADGRAALEAGPRHDDPSVRALAQKLSARPAAQTNGTRRS